MKLFRLMLCFPLAACLAARAADPLEFHAKDAKITAAGSLIKYEAGAEFRNIGGWNNTNGFATWSAPEIPKGIYRVVISYACAGDNPGSQLEISVGSQRANFTVTPTSSWTDFKEMDLGPVIIRKAGPAEITARITRVARRWAINLRTVKLVPEPAP